jgi:hypothetical protein
MFRRKAVNLESEPACGKCGSSAMGRAASTCPECGADPRAVDTNPAKCPVPALWRRLGVFAFLFFLIKGLLWLIIPTLVATGLIKAF